MGSKALVVLFLVLGVPLWSVDYLVQKGDSGLAIAQRHGVPLEVLSRANPGLEWTKLKVGARVFVPEAYVVKPGDTLYSLSRGWGLEQAEVLAFNGLASPALKVGQTLYLPGSRGLAQVPPATQSPKTPVPNPGASTSPVVAPRPSAVTPISTGSPWPVDKTPQPLGDKLKSVQFATSGEPFRSVSAGTVVYRGEFRGVGRVLLVQGADRTVFAYGNFETSAVEFGQTVGSGQLLGTTSSRPAQKLLFFAFRDSQSLDVFTAKR